MPDSLFDLRDDLVDGLVGGVDGNIGLGVERVAAVEQFFDLRQRVRGLEQGAVGLVLDALEDHFGPRREADHEACLFEGPPVHLPDHRAAAGGDHLVLAPHDLLDDPLLDLAEIGFAELREDGGDGHVLVGLDERVGVHEGIAQVLRQPRADARLADAHETGEDDVFEHSLRSISSRKQQFSFS